MSNNKLNNQRLDYSKSYIHIRPEPKTSPPNSRSKSEDHNQTKNKKSSK